MKKLFAIVFLAAASFVSFGCWFTEENFNNSYIASVNGISHYTEGTSLASAIYLNGFSVALPLTVYVKVTPHQYNTISTPIVKAVLQYKKLPDGRWTTVKTIENVSWAMNFTLPVALFGRNAIDVRNLAAGTELLIRVYFSTGLYENGDLESDITSTIADEVSGEDGIYEGGWSAPNVVRVVFNGKRRAR